MSNPLGWLPVWRELSGWALLCSAQSRHSIRRASSVLEVTSWFHQLIISIRPTSEPTGPSALAPNQMRALMPSARGHTASSSLLRTTEGT